MKTAIFHPKALEALRMLPKVVQRELGKAIRDLQKGSVVGMPLSRPMPAVSLGVSELRVRSGEGVYRAFYFLKSERRIIVFHLFAKKTQKTSQGDIELGRRRLREMLYA